MIHRSPLPDVEIPGRTLTELIVGGAGRHGDKPALVDALTGETLTYARFRESVLGHAGGLARMGLGPGEVAGLMSANQPAWAGAEELMAFVAAEVAPYKKIRSVEFVDAIPKSPTGKILRRVLKDSSAAADTSRP